MTRLAMTRVNNISGESEGTCRAPRRAFEQSAILSIIAMICCASACRPDKPRVVTNHSETLPNQQSAEVVTGETSPSMTSATTPQTTPPAPEQKRVLITIDDLPLADFSRYKSRKKRLDIVTRLTRTIDASGVPFVAFLNLNQHARDSALLPLWQSTRATMGNHTWSHPHVNKVGLDAYLKDLERGHHAVAKLRDEESGQMPYRHPYLYEGFPCDERDAIREKLAELDSRAIPITIDGWDWYYSRRYARALADKDRARADLIVGNYMGHLSEAILEAELYAERLFGRQPPQILLLHGNELNADHFEATLKLFREHGYTFITLEEAMKDEAYTRSDDTASPRGFSHWKRLYRSREGFGTCPRPGSE